MFFYIEERNIWIRSNTHTTVRDKDPAFQRFVNDRTGKVKRLLYIWLAEYKGNHACLRAYLGTFRICFIRTSLRELYRLFHLTSKAAKDTGESAKILRRNLANLLREYTNRQSPCSQSKE